EVLGEIELGLVVLAVALEDGPRDRDGFADRGRGVLRPPFLERQRELLAGDGSQALQRRWASRCPRRVENRELTSEMRLGRVGGAGFQSHARQTFESHGERLLAPRQRRSSDQMDSATLTAAWQAV